MGLEVRDVDDDDVRQFSLADDTGVVVEQVRQGGPADQAGIRENDVILQFDRTQVDGTEAFDRLLATHHPGDAVELLVGRNGRRRAVSVRLEVEP
jgi:S1-C subfamily serine protease